MFWGLPWDGLHLVCHAEVQSFHHKSAHFRNPVPLYALKKGKSRAEPLSLTLDRYSPDTAPLNTESHSTSSCHVDTGSYSPLSTYAVIYYILLYSLSFLVYC